LTPLDKWRFNYKYRFLACDKVLITQRIATYKKGINPHMDYREKRIK
jgi:hypothetical protein